MVHYIGNIGMAYCGAFFGVQHMDGMGDENGNFTTDAVDRITCGKCRKSLSLKPLDAKA